MTKFYWAVQKLRVRPANQVVWLLLGLSACGPATMAERSGESMRQGLPAALDALLPSDVVLCHEESVGDGADYHLWIFRHDSRSPLTLPKSLKRLEQHPLPSTISRRLIGSKLSQPDLGAIQESSSRFIHWEENDAEYQVREFISDRGWFASVEQIRK